MSVGASSDIGQAPVEFGEAATSSILDPGQPDQFPTEATDAALTGQGVTSEPASEGAESFDLTDDDRAWLQSEPVLSYLKEHLPPGFLTEEAHNERLSKFQSAKDQEVAEAKQQADYYLGQFEEYKLTAEQMAQALYDAWREAGIEYGSEEWNQRTQAIREKVEGVRRDREHQELTYQATMNKLASEATQEFQADLSLIGLPFNNPYVARAYTEHMKRLRSGTFQSPAQMSQDRRQLLGWAREQARRAAAAPQQQPAQQAAQSQPQVQSPQQQMAQRPTPQTRPAGATRSARGGGGSGPSSYEDYFNPRYQELIKQYGGEANIPIDAILRLDIEAAAQLHGQ